MDTAKFAVWVRRGLKMPSVVEDKRAFGVYRSGGEIFADLKSLALLGKLGAKRALRLSAKAYLEYGKYEDGPASKKIRKNLGITKAQSRALFIWHFTKGMSARRIANGLEKGRLTFKSLRR